MIKKSLMILSISAAYFANAQDVSIIKNTAEVYSNSSMNGTAKYNAMAGSMGALGGDISVLHSNPAGIAVNIASEVSGTLGIEGNNNSTSYDGSSLDYKVRNTDLTDVGGIAVFSVESSPWKFVNLAVNYSSRSLEDYSQTPSNNSLVYEIRDDNNNLVDELSFAGHAYNRYGNQSKMSVGVGGNYENRLYVGAGLNFHNLALDQYDSAAFINNAGAQDIYNKQYTPFSETANGFSASVGVIGKISPQFRMGATVETPTWWSIARVYSAYANPVDDTYSEDRTLSTPMKATLSAAYVANKNFALNVDYSLGLTKAKYKVYGDAETEVNNFFSDHAKNLSEIKVGAEYRLNALRVRGGYGYASSPFDSRSIQTVDGKTAYDNLILGERNTLSGGLGYDFGTFFLDATYQNVSSEYNSPFLQGSAAANTGYFSNNYVVDSNAAVVSNVKNTNDNFFITLGWKF